jgi:hypothetical protein
MEIGIGVQLPAGNGPFDRRAHRAHVRVEIVFRQRFEARLVVHVLPASCQDEHRQQSQGRKFS